MHDCIGARCGPLAHEAMQGTTLCTSVGSPSALQGDDAALSELLRGRGSYDVTSGASNHLAAFKPNLAALPDDISDVPMLSSLLAPDASLHLEAP